MLSAVTMGRLADRYGRTATLLVCLLLAAVLSPLHALATTVWQLLALRTAMGFASILLCWSSGRSARGGNGLQGSTGLPSWKGGPNWFRGREAVGHLGPQVAAVELAERGEGAGL
jgi:MFS family permease